MPNLPTTLKLCVEVEVEATDEYGHITAAQVIGSSVVDADHRHPDPEHIEVGTRLFFVNDLDVIIRP